MICTFGMAPLWRRQGDDAPHLSGYLTPYGAEITGGGALTLIDTDRLPDLARAVLSAGTRKDTVNAPLAQVGALPARRQFHDDARRGELAEPGSTADRAWSVRVVTHECPPVQLFQATLAPAPG